jgi:hypothetical protein
MTGYSVKVRLPTCLQFYDCAYVQLLSGSRLLWASVEQCLSARRSRLLCISGWPQEADAKVLLRDTHHATTRRRLLFHRHGGARRSRGLHSSCGHRRKPEPLTRVHWRNIAITLIDHSERLGSLEMKKGHGMCPSLFQDAQERQLFPQVDALTQCRDQDHILNGVVLCDFSLTAALWQFLALIVSCRPDLGQEVLRAVAVEHELISRRSL